MAFCKNCGKELKKGEKCNCAEEKEMKKTTKKSGTTKKEETSASGFDFAKTVNSIKDDLLMFVKNPFDVVKNNVDKNDMPKTYVMAALYVISFAIFFCIVFKLIFFTVMSSGLSEKMMEKIMDKIKIPYLKIGFYGIIIAAVLLAAYAVAMLVIPAVFKNKKIDFKKSLTLTSSAMLPMVVVNLVCGLLALININYKFIIIVYLLTSLAVTYNYVYAYAKITEVEDNKFGYAIALLVAIALGATYLCIYLTGDKFTESLTKEITNSTLDTNDLFN